MPSDDHFRTARADLVRHLREKGIHNERVLAAVGAVPRHRFIDPGLRHRAYNDEALPIGWKQTISQPFTVAYQTSLLDVRADDRVLEIGTGSGYQAAILCEMGVRVFSIERHRALLERTRALLQSLGYNPVLRYGDGTFGWSASAPYDGIVVTAGAIDVPEALLRQLREPSRDHAAGRLVVPIGNRRSQRMNRITRTGPDLFEREELEHCRFVPLIGHGGGGH